MTWFHVNYLTRFHVNQQLIRLPIGLYNIRTSCIIVVDANNMAIEGFPLSGHGYGKTGYHNFHYRG